MTWIEGIATLFGLLCVWLTIQQNVWCWPTGLIQVSLYIFIFYETKLYADVVLHVIYVGLSIYGWINWTKKKGSALIVSKTDKMLFWVPILITGTIIWGYSLTAFTDASVPYIDSFVVISSLIAQWLMTKKKLESWYFWILADIVAIGVYAYKQLFITCGLYSVFLVMAVIGYFAWQKDLHKQKQYFKTASI